MIVRLVGKDLNAFHATFSVSPYNKPYELFEQYFVEQQQGLCEVYAVLDAGNIVGYGTLVWQSPYPPFAAEQIPEIKDINVLVEHRRRGHATALIEHLEQRARDKGYLVIGIGAGVTPDYEAARRLYPLFGYLPDGNGVYPDQWGGAIYFTKAL